MYLVEIRPRPPTLDLELITCYVTSFPSKMTSRVVKVTSLRNRSLGDDSFYSVESASCGVAMEVAKADSKTNWEALMNHINSSIRYYHILKIDINQITMI